MTWKKVSELSQAWAQEKVAFLGEKWSSMARTEKERVKKVSELSQAWAQKKIETRITSYRLEPEGAEKTALVDIVALGIASKI